MFGTKGEASVNLSPLEVVNVTANPLPKLPSKLYSKNDSTSIVALPIVGNEPVVATGATSVTLPAPSTGPHFVTVRATDRAGNVGEVGVPFSYGGPGGQGALGVSALDFGLLLLLFGVIAVSAAYLAVRRRRRSGPP